MQQNHDGGDPERDLAAAETQAGPAGARRSSSDAKAARRPLERTMAVTAGQDRWESDTIPDLADLPRGAHVGEYRIRRKLEEGGMGTVYAAIHPVIERKVAIKVLHAGLSSDRNVVARFVQEARAACRVGHPGIVDVFGFGQLSDGRHYIIMEYLHGQQLLSLLRERAPLAFEVALPIIRGVCEPLEAAHKSNIVHRDLKPENVFLVPRPDGEWPPRVKVLDFGLAKLLEPSRQMGPATKTGTTLGTCYYMAPEQCRGQAVDARSDVYALGVMMYEMMTGRVPFYSASSVEVMFMHLREQPEPPSQHAPVAPGVERLILECMAKKPEDRPQTMSAVLERLRTLETEMKQAIDPRQIAAVTNSITKAAYVPTDSITFETKWVKRAERKWLVPTLVALLGVLAISLACVIWLLLSEHGR